MPSLSRCPGPPHRGFTLIELMIAVVVATILLALALPSFLDQVRRSRRSDGVDAVVAVQQAQERFRGSNPSYATTLAALSLNAGTANGYYTIALAGVNATGYTVSATAVAGKSQASDGACSTLTVAVANGSPAYTPVGCWSR